MYISISAMTFIVVVLVVVFLFVFIAYQDLDEDNMYLRTKVRKLFKQCKDYEALIEDSTQQADEFTVSDGIHDNKLES